MFATLFNETASPRSLRRENSAPKPAISHEESWNSVWRSATVPARPPRALRYPFPVDAIPTFPAAGITIPETGQ
jgi:hypothetical protein